jgi:hypothetical protein
LIKKAIQSKGATQGTMKIAIQLMTLINKG